MYFVAGKDNCCQSYGEQKIDQKMTFSLALNFENIEGMDLKLMILYYLFRHYAQTKFHSILKGQDFFVLI